VGLGFDGGAEAVVDEQPCGESRWKSGSLHSAALRSR
jgi:hypothetical protein